MATERKTHPDGTPCKEGTRSVPSRHVACCETFAGHLSTCDLDVRYEWWPRPRQWVITIAESAGGGGIVIRYCPHCGAELQPRTRAGGRGHGGGQAGRRIALQLPPRGPRARLTRR
jgi:hypothetical protein